jgi:hypothetical protein
MAKAWDKKDFSSWEQALRQKSLTEQQLRTLDTMVESGEAKTRDEAAQRLDWLDTVIDPDEHMYGF